MWVPSIAVAQPADITPTSVWSALTRADPSLAEESSSGMARTTALRMTPELRLLGSTSELMESRPLGRTLRQYDRGVVHAEVFRDAGASVQNLLYLGDRRAPAEFIFDVTGSELNMDGDGVVTLRGPDGQRWTVAPAWAVDAAGTPVPTSFEVRGNRLVQVVNHRNGDYKYPIVADPFLGRTIFQNLTRDRDSANRDVQYNGKLTSWGWSIYTAARLGGVVGGISGQVILRTNGWDEWRAVWPAITNKPALKQQFDCHALGAFAAGDWNIERFRANKSNWLPSVLSHRCNW